MTNTLLSAEYLEPESPAIGCVIWLHGLGADGADFLPVAQLVQQTVSTPLRFILPNAPLKSVTLNGGLMMPAWYDLYGLTRTDREDEAGLLVSESAMHAFIESQLATGLQSQQIFLAGFSQGAALALFAGLRFKNPLGGLIALSGYLPLAAKIPDAPSTQALPVFFGYGTEDGVVTPDLCESSLACLKTKGIAAQVQRYPMGHSVCPEEIGHVCEFLERNLTPYVASEA